MLRNRFLLTALAATVLTISPLVTGSAAASQNWSNYNRSQTLSLLGEVQNVYYHNPIVTLQLQTGGQTWQAVLAPPTDVQHGRLLHALQVGQTVRLAGFPHRTQANQMRVEQLVIDNQSIALR